MSIIDAKIYDFLNGEIILADKIRNVNTKQKKNRTSIPIRFAFWLGLDRF